MSCDDGYGELDGELIHEMERLLDLLRSESGQLAEIEREIVEALGARPIHTWCLAQLRMLRMLHAKAQGLSWRDLLDKSG